MHHKYRHNFYIYEDTQIAFRTRELIIQLNIEIIIEMQWNDNFAISTLYIETYIHMYIHYLCNTNILIPWNYKEGTKNICWRSGGSWGGRSFFTSFEGGGLKLFAGFAIFFCRNFQTFLKNNFEMHLISF